MKIVVASDSFKGSMTAKEIGECVELGIKRYSQNFEIVNIPMADGGEGTVQSLVDAMDGEIITTQVRDPLNRLIESYYGILGNDVTAVIEMATASGLTLIDNSELNAYITSTYGTGQLIKSALDRGCREFIIGIGGSATNDGGVGMLKSLGIKFLDKNGEDLPCGGKALEDLCSIDVSRLDSRIKDCSFCVACDVKNTLCGKYGATSVYGPQKGATPEMVICLDNALRNYANVVKKEFNKDIDNIDGAGAAGGLGAAFVGFLGAKLLNGIDIVIEITKLEEIIKTADLVVTGEGKIDSQTRFGKTPYGVAKLAKKYDIPVIGLCGVIGNDIDVLYDYGFGSIVSIVDRPMSSEYAMANAKKLVENCAYRFMKLYML